MYLKLRRDVSVATSGRSCCYVAMYQMLRRDVISFRIDGEVTKKD